MRAFPGDTVLLATDAPFGGPDVKDYGVALLGRPSCIYLEYRHAVVTIEGTRLASLLGPGERLVNSIHHQAVDTLAPGFRVSAMAPDGVIEGMEYEGEWDAVGIQWHPEKTDDPPAMALFASLVDQARGRLSRRVLMAPWEETGASRAK